MSDMKWWGYLHSGGTVQVKLWLGDHRDYTDDCNNNPFVLYVVKPFAAASSAAALEHICQEIHKHYVRPNSPEALQQPPDRPV